MTPQFFIKRPRFAWVGEQPPAGLDMVEDARALAK